MNADHNAAIRAELEALLVLVDGHTPGPWVIPTHSRDLAVEIAKSRKEPCDQWAGWSRTNDGAWAVAAPESGTRVLLADSFPISRPKRGYEYCAPDPEGMANARLAAAAPRLLEMVRALLDEQSTKAESEGR